MSERRYPPVTELGMFSLVLIVIGGIYLSSNLPHHVSLGPAVALLAGSAVVLTINLALLARVKDFPWDRFLEVARWALLAYVAIAALIEYAFLRNHVKGGTLVVLTLSLVVFAVHVPILIGFTVARFYEPDTAAGSGISGVETGSVSHG
jgi:hypothetical protein